MLVVQLVHNYRLLRLAVQLESSSGLLEHNNNNNHNLPPNITEFSSTAQPQATPEEAQGIW